MRSLLIPLILTGAIWGQDPTGPTKLEFVASIGTGEIGSETATVTANGWSTKGSFDILGTQTGEYSVAYERTKAGFTLKIHTDSRGRKVEIDATCVDGTVTATVNGRDEKRTIKVPKGRRLFMFENLVWASFIDMGPIIEELDAAGKLEKGVAIPAVTVLGGAAFDVTFESSRIEEQVVNGRAITVRVSDVRIPPSVDLTLVSAKDTGHPLRIDIPGQQLVVVTKGYEEIVGVAAKPTSIVDAGPWRAQLSKPDHEVVVQKGVMIPMRDGIKLASDVYRPKGEGPFPTVLARTPYNRKTEGGIKGKWYAQRGYVFVAQDVRGRFGSEGKWFPFTSEERDGSDTIDWIAEQPWSDDRVGMIGASYVGLVQWLAAKSANPHLKCIVPQVSPPDPYENFPYEGGIFLMGAAWWARVLDGMKHGTDWQGGIDWLDALAKLPLEDLDKSMKLSEPSGFLKEWLSHPPHDREFWDHAIYQDRFETMTVPAFHVTGWYDGDMPGALMNYAGMKARAKTEHARNGQYLVVGPWTHLFNTSRRIGKTDFGPEGKIDLDARILRFFDRYLKDVDNGIEKEPHVHTFTMGSNRWHGQSEWPVEGTQFTKLHFSSNGHAARRDGDGRLALEPTTKGAESESYRYDPMDLPELDIDFGDLSGAQATEDQNGEKDRHDDLTYTSPPLAEPCEIVGDVTVKVWVSTDAADTDFAASLYRITKDGGRFALRSGVQRLRYATDPTKDIPIKPGTVVPVSIDLWATGQRFDAGDRFQVEVSSWVWPGYARNLNTLESPLTATKGVVATNTIHQTEDRPSHILLPVVPREDAPGIRFATR